MADLSDLETLLYEAITKAVVMTVDTGDSKIQNFLSPVGGTIEGYKDGYCTREEMIAKIRSLL